MTITVVIPVLNEAGNIGKLVEEIFDAVPDSALAQIIVVDDASTDGTAAELAALSARFRKFRTLRHATRSGQSCAIRTGVLAASSAIIATLDGDGQNDPRDIMPLAAQLGRSLAEGPVLVSGVRTRRKARGSKLIASKMANAIRNFFFRDDCPDSGCGLKLFWREAYLRLPFFTSMHRFMPTMFRAYGYATAYLPVNDRTRVAGQSKYNNFNRALIGLYDILGVVWLTRRTRVPAIAADSSQVSRANITELRRGDGGRNPVKD